MRSMHREIPSCAFHRFNRGLGKGPEVFRNASAGHRSVDFPEASLFLAGCSVSFVGPCSNQSLPAADPAPRRRFPFVRFLKKEIEKCRPRAACTISPTRRDPSTKSSSGRCGGCRKPVGAPKRGCKRITCSAIIDSPSKERRMSHGTVHRYTLIAAGKLSILIYSRTPWPQELLVRFLPGLLG